MSSPYSRDLTPVSSTTVTAGASAYLSTILAAASVPATIDVRLKALWLVPSTGVTAAVFMGTAATGQTAIPAVGLEIPCNAGSAGLLKIYGNGALDVWQFVQG